MQPERKIEHNLLFSLLLILIFSTTGFSQTSEANNESDVIPNRIMKQIAKKVLTHYFKPRNQKKVVYLSDEGIQQSWLPQIKGINFQIINIQGRRLKYHFVFWKNPFDKNTVGFAFGSDGAGYNGDIWHFRTLKQTVIIWKNKDERFGASGQDHGNRPGMPLPPPPPMPKKP